jgi:hypothetical protein
MTIYNETMNGGLNASGTTPWNYTAGHTARNVTGGDGFAYAMEWASCQTREEMLSHKAASEFESRLQNAPTLQGDRLELVRVRGVVHLPPSPLDFGPPPEDCRPRGQRYNREGERVLYLADCEEGLRREYRNWHDSGTPYVQVYHLPIGQLKIADFAGLPPTDFISAVFSIAEECAVAGRGPDSFSFSQAVSELVSARFHGMRVPGVRGNRNAHYKNVIVFRPHPEWQNWLAPAALPYLLETGLGDDEIAVGAYFIWEKEGRPDGRHLAHWYLAIDELMRARSAPP